MPYPRLLSFIADKSATVETNGDSLVFKKNHLNLKGSHGTVTDLNREIVSIFPGKAASLSGIKTPLPTSDSSNFNNM